MTKKTNMKEENDIIKASFTVDDSPIFDALDNYFASLPLNVLEEARKQNIENGEDTEIIDKAIKERIRKDAELKKTQEKIVEKERQYQREKRKAIRKSILAGIFSSFIDNSINSNENSYGDLTSFEKDQVNNGNYELFQFEEEELEDDDYYYEDE